MIPSLKRLPRRGNPGQLTAGALLFLDWLHEHPQLSDGVLPLSAESIAAELGHPPERVLKYTSSLEARGYVLCSSKGLAVSSRLSVALKKEIDRNRLRRKCPGGPAPDWSLRQRVHDLFPQLRGARSAVKRPESYNRPSAFEALLKEHPFSHLDQQPANVERLTDACYPGELQTILTLIEEQRSAGRAVHLLYTRKALYVGVIRNPKR